MLHSVNAEAVTNCLSQMLGTGEVGDLLLIISVLLIEREVHSQFNSLQAFQLFLSLSFPATNVLF